MVRKGTSGANGVHPPRSLKVCSFNETTRQSLLNLAHAVAVLIRDIRYSLRTYGDAIGQHIRARRLQAVAVVAVTARPCQGVDDTRLVYDAKAGVKCVSDVQVAQGIDGYIEGTFQLGGKG